MEEIPEDIRAQAFKIADGWSREDDERDDMQADISRAILAERKRWQREMSDKLYMLQAYREMLGPIGLQVADLWRTKGLQRVHHDWGPDAAALTGEERAKFLLGLAVTLSSSTRGAEHG